MGKMAVRLGVLLEGTAVWDVAKPEAVRWQEQPGTPLYSVKLLAQ